MAISIKPKDTFRVFSHPPDLAILLSKPGKKAKKANGNAIAIENPRNPIIGPTRSFCFVTSTNKSPMKGAVHEKDTNTSVSAIKKIPKRLLWLAFESTLFVQEAGSVMSNAPKNDTPKIMNNTNTKILNTALVETWYKKFFPKSNVGTNARTVNITMIEIE